MPRSVNGVVMELPELIESLSLIGGQFHIDHANAAPALVLLQAAYRAIAGNSSVTLRLRAGSVEAALPSSAEATEGKQVGRSPALVIHA